MTRPRQPLSGQLPEQKKTIRIPVRIRTKGGIEYFYGGALPEISDGTIGDLVVPGHCHVNRVGPRRPAWIPFQAAALALSHTLNASFRNRLNVNLSRKCRWT